MKKDRQAYIAAFEKERQKQRQSENERQSIKLNTVDGFTGAPFKTQTNRQVYGYTPWKVNSAFNHRHNANNAHTVSTSIEKKALYESKSLYE